MTDTKTLFAHLNKLRVANGFKPLKAWKESRAKLEYAIEYQEEGVEHKQEETVANENDTVTIAQVARELGLNPKVCRAKARRHAEKLCVDYANDGWVFIASRKAELVAFLQG